LVFITQMYPDARSTKHKEKSYSTLLVNYFIHAILCKKTTFSQDHINYCLPKTTKSKHSKTQEK